MQSTLLLPLSKSANESPVEASPAFNTFCNLLGEKIELQGWDHYAGGLDCKGIASAAPAPPAQPLLQRTRLARIRITRSGKEWKSCSMFPRCFLTAPMIKPRYPSFASFYLTISRFSANDTLEMTSS